MTEYIEGKRPVVEALRGKAPLQKVLLADNVKKDELIADIERLAKKAGIPTERKPRRELDALSERGSHQGVMAQSAPYPYVSLQEVIISAGKQAETNDGAALVIVLDHITDAGNLGAIARSAEVVGAAGIVIPNKRSAHVTAATYKSSAGAIGNIRVTQVANIAQAIDRLKEEGFWVAGASEHAEQGIWDANLKGRIALVMGNEGNGLARLTQDKCDFLVALPQVGKTSSLNVAQASTAVMYEWMRQNREGLGL